MTYAIDLPNLNSNDKSVKDLTINALLTDWPLSLNALFHLMKKRYNLGVSYQAVHKAMNDLVKSNVVLRNGKKYQLSTVWIKDVKDFATRLEASYSNKDPLSVWDSDANLHSFSFNSYYELNRFMLAGIQRFLCSPEYKDLIVAKHWQLSLWPLFIRPEDYHILEKITNPKRVYVTIRDSSVVAKFSRNFFRRLGVNYKIGVDLEQNFDFCVIGDSVLQIYYPGQILNDFARLFLSTKDMNNINTRAALKIFERQEKIDVLVIKNRSIAEALSRRVISQFKHTQQ